MDSFFNALQALQEYLCWLICYAYCGHFANGKNIVWLMPWEPRCTQVAVAATATTTND